ncbi:MAG: alpha/beta fold hydrolase [Ilumatobacteraceae bacterium]
MSVDGVVLTRDDGGPLALHRLGGDGPPLLISHAAGFHGRCYRAVARNVREHTVWALDYRGHGASREAAMEPTDFWCFVSDFVVAAQHLAPGGGLRVFGHSMGAATVIMSAIDHPGLVSSLIGFEPIAPPPSEIDPETIPIAVGARRRRSTFASVDAAIENYASKPPLAAFAPDVLEDYVRYGTVDADDGDGIELACRPSFEAAVFTSAHRFPLFAQLPEIDLATTVISGVVQDMQPSAFAAAVANRLPNGHLISRSDLDHFGPFVDPSAVAEIINSLYAQPSS